MRLSMLMLSTALLLVLQPAFAPPADATVACVDAKKGKVKKNSRIVLRKSCPKGELQLDVSALVIEGRVCTAEDEADARDLIERVQTRFEVGLVPFRDVRATEILLRDTLLCTGAWTRRQYCEEGTVLIAEDLAAETEQAYNAGQASIGDVLETRRGAITRRALCR